MYTFRFKKIKIIHSFGSSSLCNHLERYTILERPQKFTIGNPQEGQDDESVQNHSSAMIRKKRGRKKGLFRRIFKFLFYLGLVGFIVGIAAAVGIYFYLNRGLPKITTLADYKPPIVSSVYSEDGYLIGEFFKERRIMTPLEKMPPILRNAFVAAEDSRFYKHRGVDLYSIARAFLKNIEAGTIVQGGSTITQQVTKSFFLSPKRSYERKIKEAILAYRIDRTFSKAEILYLYLNQIYLGHGAYGVGAAAENYFGKSVEDLTLAECAILAGLPQAPSRYSPFKALDKAQQRQIYVLNRMVEDGYITNVEATNAMAQQLEIKPRRNLYLEKAPYYTEYVRQYVEEKYGTEALYKEGLTIHTAVHTAYQGFAQKAIEKGLRALDKRQGYRGPKRHLPANSLDEYIENASAKIDVQGGLIPDHIYEAAVTKVLTKNRGVQVQIGNQSGTIGTKSMGWALKSKQKPSDVLAVGDVVDVRLGEKPADGKNWQVFLEQEPTAQGALLSISPENGHVVAMVGGHDFKNNQFNRAIQARRQPGSAFKPVVYAAAIDKGYTPATVMIDSPVIFRDKAKNRDWKPENYQRSFQGKVLLRSALAKSMNVITIKILQDIGIDYTIDYARNLGITAPINADLSLALGSSGVSLLEVVNAYTVFNNLGYKITPIFITKIIDRDGEVLEDNIAVREKAIASNTAYIVTNMLESVVKYGTGTQMQALKRPVAGKTGTTNDLKDAWFVGYTPRFVTGTWVGHDKSESLGPKESGAKAAGPIWLDYMAHVLEDKPVRVFQVPEDVVFAKIDVKTGLLAIAESEETRFECFKAGTAPTLYSKKPGVVSETDELFKKMLN